MTYSNTVQIHGNLIFLRNFRFKLIIPVLLFCASVFAQDLEIHHINVQQGTSVLVIGPDGTTLLFDGGRPGKGTAEVAPYLESLGITSSLDYMVLSHRDADHYAGLTEIINAGYDVLTAVYDNGSDKTGTTITDFINATATTTAGTVTGIPLGTVINLGSGATATCVAVNGDVIGSGAVPGALNNENDRSVALLIQHGDFDFLIAGDMGGGDSDNSCTGRSTGQVNVETPLVQAIMPGGANPLLSSFGVEVHHVNHHGSESSTNSDVMNLLTPSLACISVGPGQGGSFHHPRIDVVENVLLAQASCISAPSALVLQTEEGSPTGSSTSFEGYSVGDIIISTDGITNYMVDATGQVSQGPDERTGAGLPLFLPFDESTGSGSGGVVFSEVFYDTPGTDSQEEWVELYNAGSSAVNIGGWSITDNNGTGGTLVLPGSATIAAGSYFTIAKNQSGFQALYGYDADVYGSLPSLNNTGDALILNDDSAQEMDAVAWEGGASGGLPAGWGSSTEPNAPTGNTIERSDPNTDSDTFSDWALAANNGNPQTQASANVPPIAVANGPYNGTAGQSVNFSSAGSNDPDGTIVSYLWDFGDGNTSGSANPSHTYASAATYNVSLTVTDDGGATGVDNTTASISAPAVPAVVISEVFYDTPGTDSQEEWVELFNNTTSPVNIGGWSISDDNGNGGVLVLPGGTTIAAESYLTIASDQAGFSALYGYDADIYGNIPSLNNTGDALVLRDAGAQDIDAVGWEGGAGSGLPAGWGSSSDPNAPTGNTIERIDPYTDSNLFSDWAIAANNGNPQTQAPAGGSILLAEGVLSNIGDSWTTVNLANSYNSMVVVCAVSHPGTEASAVARVRNASGSSFEVRVQNPDGGALSNYTVHYMVVEEGVYTQAADGVTMEAVKFTSTVTDRKGSWSAESRSYSNSYSNPVVLGQVMTYNDSDWSVFWASSGSRTSPPSSSSLAVGKHVGEDTNTSRSDETIGYIVIESGSGSIEGIGYSAGLGADQVKGFDDSPSYDYNLSGLTAASSAVVSAAAMDGNDGGWPSLYGSTPLTASTLGLVFEEDQISNSERKHTTEQVAYMVFGSAAAKVFAGNDPSDDNVIESFALLQNYPNPFNPSTTIAFRTSDFGSIDLSVYNSLGQKVRTLVREDRAAGEYRVQWDGRDNFGRLAASGVYFYRLVTPEGVLTKRMMLTK